MTDVRSAAHWKRGVTALIALAACIIGLSFAIGTCARDSVVATPRESPTSHRTTVPPRGQMASASARSPRSVEIIASAERDDTTTPTSATSNVLDLADGKPADTAGLDWREVREREGQEENPRWGFASLRAQLRVLDEAGQTQFSLANVRIRYSVDGTRRGADPWSPQWMSRHNVRTRDSLNATVVNESELVVLVPRIRGLRLSADHPGYIPRAVSIDISSRPNDAVVEIRLRKAHTIRGRLLDEQGHPISGAPVTVFVEKRVPSGSVDIEDLMALHRGISIRDDHMTARVTLINRVVTNQDGKYESQLNFEGDTELYAWIDGHSLGHADLGEVASDRDDVEMIAPMCNAPRFVTFKLGEKVLANAQIVFADISARVGQPSPGPVKLDGSGRMSMSWLTLGHKYHIWGWGSDFGDNPPRGVIEWTEQSAIDLSRDLQELK